MRILHTLAVFAHRFFRVETSRRQKIKSKIALLFAAVVAVLLSVAGYTVVYARSYAVMNDTPLVVWEVSKDGDKTAVTYLGRTFTF
jgi:hypothetical protein